MSQRDFILKWLLYALALLPILVLEQYILPLIPIFGIIPTLLPIAAVTLAVLEGPAAGAGFGLFVGILCDALSPGVPGAMTLGLALLGLASGTASRYGVQQNILGCLICSAAALSIIDLFRVIFYLLRGAASLWKALIIALPEIIISLVFLPLVYGILLWVHRRVPQASLL